MSGTVVNLFNKRPYTFASGGTVLAVKAVDVSQFTEASLAVRVHDNNMGGSSTVVVRTRVTLPSPEDPAVDFVAAVADACTTVVTVSTGLADGTLLRAVVPVNFGGYLRVEVVGTVSGGACDAVISADLVGKD
jgi:hypothetical protein